YISCVDELLRTVTFVKLVGWSLKKSEKKPFEPANQLFSTVTFCAGVPNIAPIDRSNTAQFTNLLRRMISPSTPPTRRHSTWTSSLVRVTSWKTTWSTRMLRFVVPSGHTPNCDFVSTEPPTDPPSTLMFDELCVRIVPFTVTFLNVTSSVSWYVCQSPFT